jgi:pimeloyl-ACP methyl ester carboxylesterase
MTRTDTAASHLSGPRLSGRSGSDPALVAYALADGTVIAVSDTGPRDAAQIVVLVHGWTMDHTSWDDVVSELHCTHPRLRVVAYDSRGHGWSDAGPKGTSTIDQLADDLADVITGYLGDPHGAGERDIVVGGHSLGGPVLMSFAERHPALLTNRVAGLALVATSAAGLGKDLFGLSARLTAPVMLLQPVITWPLAVSRARVNLHYPQLLAPFLRQGFFGVGGATKHNRARMAAQVGRSHPATTAALVGEMAHHDRLHSLAELEQTPTVVLAGTRDGLCPMAHSRAIVEALPGAELVVYPEAGHMLNYERPAEVAAQIARLFR